MLILKMQVSVDGLVNVTLQVDPVRTSMRSRVTLQVDPVRHQCGQE
jgi:hypothetical protein